MHALTGWSGPNTLRIQGKIGSHTVIILVDSGSTLNFINERLVRLIQIPVTPINPFGVKIANGEVISCPERYDAVDLQIQECNFQITLFSLPLRGLDLVLGVHWLQQLGPMFCAWSQPLIRFQWEGHDRVLVGLQGQSAQQIESQALTRELEPVCIARECSRTRQGTQSPGSVILRIIIT